MADQKEVPRFPEVGILPKESTQALGFVSNNPDFDGRDVCVAIFDTGCDPGAAGLIETSTGARKFVDLVDATGSGDVQTNVVKTINGKNELVGVSGRTLVIPQKWSNPTGKYHLGVKRAYDMWPKTCTDRIKKLRKKNFTKKSQEFIDNLHLQIGKLSKSHEECSEKSEKESIKVELSDVKARLEQLQKLESGYEDLGSMYDCVVFHDGDVWRAVVDTSECGDLKSCHPPMTDYRKEFEFTRFSDKDMLNFSVNVYDDGNVLSIVTTAGYHGTHVAGIVGAYYKDDPSLNGVAPGCTLVSVKIGDSRMGSMETHSGLIRGLKAVLDNKCDMINMSYGERSSVTNTGMFNEFVDEVVYQHGVIFCSSGGNNGPALSTCGAPAVSSTSAISVAAIVTPQMVISEYGFTDTVPMNAYTWSSRGPAVDGGPGVTICGPGGAIAPVPEFTLRKSQLLNGTSMASPNVCGSIALVLSGLKQKGVKYSPQRVQHGVENTAKTIDCIERLAQGHGLVQVQDTFDYILESHEKSYQDLHFDVSVWDGRGIYLREPNQTCKKLNRSVKIEAKFPEDADNEAKVAFELKVSLKTTQPWIKTADHILLVHGGRRFGVAVDPTHESLGPGVHFGEVLGYDSNAPELGPVFALPITVILPHNRKLADGDGNKDEAGSRGDVLKSVKFSPIRYSPGHIERRFLTIPPGATTAEITVRSVSDHDTPIMFVLHTIYIQEQDHISDNTEFVKYFSLLGDSVEKFGISVREDRTLEVCVAQSWRAIGECEVEFDVEFKGLTCSAPSIDLQATSSYTRIDVTSALGSEKLEPQLSLKKFLRPVMPKTNEIAPLTKRDVTPKGKQIYSLELSYSWKQPTKGKTKPIFPRIHQQLYESTLVGAYWLLFDQNKQFIDSGDTWTSKDVELRKNAEYTLRLQIRHQSIARLEKLKNLKMTLECRLDKPVTLQIYSSLAKLVSGNSTFSNVKLSRNASVPLFIKGPGTVKLTKVGDTLCGNLQLQKNFESSQGSGSLSHIVPVRAAVGLAAVKSNNSSNSSNDEEKLELNEQLRDIQIDWLSKLKGKKQTDTCAEALPALLKSFPEHLPLLLLQLSVLHNDSQRSDHLQKIVDLADHIISLIDVTDLAAHYGAKLGDDAEAKKKRKLYDKTKKQLLDALYYKCVALKDICDGHNEEKGVNERDDGVSENAILVKEPAVSPEDAGDSTAEGRQEQSHSHQEQDHPDSSEGDDDLPPLEEFVNLAVSGTIEGSAEVKQPDASPDKDESTEFVKFKDTISELKKFADTKTDRYLDLHVWFSLQNKCFGEALKVLNAEIASKECPPKSLLIQRAETMSSLGWDHWNEHERNWLIRKFPVTTELF